MEEKQIKELSNVDLDKVAGGVGGAYHQYVRAGSDSLIRRGAGLNCPKIDTLYSGREVPYLGENEKDDRGMIWYKVMFKGTTGWASSTQTVIVEH